CQEDGASPYEDSQVTIEPRGVRYAAQEVAPVMEERTTGKYHGGAAQHLHAQFVACTFRILLQPASLDERGEEPMHCRGSQARLRDHLGDTERGAFFKKDMQSRDSSLD